jgi:hypothetical protein
LTKYVGPSLTPPIEAFLLLLERIFGFALPFFLGPDFDPAFLSSLTGGIEVPPIIPKDSSSAYCSKPIRKLLYGDVVCTELGYYATGFAELVV